MMSCNNATMVAAYADGETDALQSHSMKRHLLVCANCAAKRDGLLALRGRIRAEVPRFRAPSALRARVLANFEAARPSAPVRSRIAVDRWSWLTGGVLTGCAATMLAWFVGTAVLDWRTNEDVAVAAVTSHVRATLGNQLIQVASSDQHTVKPWLSARLDYALPVFDLPESGFVLAGARIDSLDRRPVATLVYRYGNHVVDVFVRPLAPGATGPALATVRGFNVARAVGAGMEWRAVADVDPAVLGPFVERLANAGPAPPPR